MYAGFLCGLGWLTYFKAYVSTIRKCIAAIYQAAEDSLTLYAKYHLPDRGVEQAEIRASSEMAAPASVCGEPAQDAGSRICLLAFPFQSGFSCRFNEQISFDTEQSSSIILAETPLSDLQFVLICYERCISFLQKYTQATGQLYSC